MKIRNSFVSNSSSSSFIVSLKDLTGDQVSKIKNHLENGKAINIDFAQRLSLDDSWRIYEEEGNLKGFTIMDNFDMVWFMEQIGIDMSKVEWDD